MLFMTDQDLLIVMKKILRAKNSQSRLRITMRSNVLRTNFILGRHCSLFAEKTVETGLHAAIAFL